MVVSENFAANFGVEPGDVVRLNTPHGPRTLPIAATARNYDSDQGAIMMARSLFVSLFDDERAGFLLVRAQPGVDPETVRAAIIARHGEAYQLVIFTNAELRRDITVRIDRAFLPASALLILGLIVGCAGIANSQQVAITERVHELGVLRSIGSRRRDVSRMIVLEAAVLGALGALLGIALGGLLSYAWVVIHVRHVLGWMIDYHFAGRGALAAVVAAVATAAGAGWFPARRAARLPPVQALAGK